MQDEQDVQNQNLVTDEAAASLDGADVSNQPPAGGPQAPGQQFTPDPAAADPVAEPTIGDVGSTDELPAFQPPEPEEPAAVTPDPATATPEPTPVMPDEDTAAVENAVAAVAEGAPAEDAPTETAVPAETEEAEQTPEETPTVSPFKVEGEEVDETPTEPTAETEATPVEEPATDDTSPTDSDASELDEIKRKALEELTPLVDQLDLEPTKRYDLLMEIIQAGNHDHLLKDAYEAAHNIEDDNLRAQALMEVVNEVEHLKGNKK